MPSTASLEKLLARGRDDALMRFSLGTAWLAEDDPARAAEHLAVAVQHDPAYSAAWKLLGKALASAGRPAEALEAYESGMAAAESGGDKQAAKEMAVFARRIRRELEAS